MNITHEWLDEPDPTNLPQISDLQLIYRAHCLHHVIYDSILKGYRLTEALDYPNPDAFIRQARYTSLLWEPKFRAGPVLPERSILKEIAEIEFYISCNYHGFFKPSLAEVLSAIDPFELLMREQGLRCFQILPHVKILKSGSYQKATMRLMSFKV